MTHTMLLYSAIVAFQPSDRPGNRSFYVNYVSNMNLDELSDEEEIYYFAYGSNMDKDQMDRRRVDTVYHLSKRGRWPEGWGVEVNPAIPIGAAILRGYQFNFNKKGQFAKSPSYASVAPNENSNVEGVLYKLDKKFMKILDFYEGVSLDQYTRELVDVVVQTEGNEKTSFPALIYIAHPNALNQQGVPSKEYLNTIIRGAERIGLSEGCIARLKQSPTAD